jgi:hypothetical protein
MKRVLVGFLLTVCLLAGCVTKSECNRRVRAAYLAGQNQALQQDLAGQTNANSVWIIGNVRNPRIPWSADLTLARALVQADYQGAGDPGQIVINRNGNPPLYISAKQLLNGYDLPLLAGDRVEVRP